jgi:cobalamin biosynthesis protein CbiD
MFDLNTIIVTALNQAIEQATKPLIERITALESQALAARLAELESYARLQGSLNTNSPTADQSLLYRLDTRVAALEGAQADAITADQVSSLIEEALNEIDWDEQVQDALNSNMLEETVNDAIDEMLSELRISRR